MTRYFLGIDWGKSKVGLALADDETRMAFGLSTITNDDSLVRRLGEIIRENLVKTVIIGIPSRINREEVEYGGEELGRELERRFGVRIGYQNEMYTTKIAREHLKEQGMRNLDRHDDREAARIILEEWLGGAGKKKNDN